MYNYAEVENGIVVGVQSSTKEINHPALVPCDESVTYGYTYIDGVFVAPQEEAPMPVIPLSNLEVANAAKVGDIYWVQEGAAMVITGDCALPDGSLIVMAEQVVDATNAISDTRFKADILNGVVTLTAKFNKSGNYMITASRVNRGLDRIGAGVNLSFDDIEFDVYV